VGKVCNEAIGTGLCLHAKLPTIFAEERGRPDDARMRALEARQIVLGVHGDSDHPDVVAVDELVSRAGTAQ